MFGRKSKNQIEQGRIRQSRQGSSRPASPTFSYYANRPADTTARRPVERSLDNVGKEVRRPQTGRSVLARAPYWLLMIVVIVCAAKLLLLSTSPKIIVLGSTSTTNAYEQTTATYVAAAHKILTSSVTNRTKLTVNADGTARDLQAQFPELEMVSLAVPLTGNRPIVYLEVTQPSVVLQTGKGNYALNANGLVLAKLTKLPAGVPTLTDQSSGQQVVVGKQFLPGSTVRFITQFSYQLQADHIAVATYVLPPTSPYELDVHLASHDYIVKTNLQLNGVAQAGAAIATIDHLGSTNPASYIDVRVPGRAYYK